LSYVIAPGTYVYNVSMALDGGKQGGQRTLKISPYSDQRTSFDFEKGDTIEQAIGPDPFKPMVFRTWMWEDVPGAFPSPVFDISNKGAASRYAVMNVSGGGVTLESAERRKEKKPAWENIFVLSSAADVGVNCMADFSNAAILFQQNNREQPIKWHYGHEEKKAPREATLTVSRQTGEMNFKGGGIQSNGPLSSVHGLSAGSEPARNLRGKNIFVEKGKKEAKVDFGVPERDANYALFVEQSWMSNRAITAKTAAGFTVQFDKAAPENATLDWMLVR
jgi:hypothetical protein